MLVELCNSHHIIAIQIHWLSMHNLDKLNRINNNFNVFGVSGINSLLSSGLLRGRPLVVSPFYGKNVLSLLIFLMLALTMMAIAWRSDSLLTAGLLFCLPCTFRVYQVRKVMKPIRVNVWVVLTASSITANSG